MDFDKRTQRNDSPVGIVAVTRNGVRVAMRIQGKLPGSIVYVPARHGFALAMGAVRFHRIGSLLPEIWLRHRALVCIMATGIVVRLIAPLLRHKASDPAVVVLDERAQYVISLVSGHLGGANELARKIAAFTGGQAVITTASDVDHKPALDLIALEVGLDVENPPMLARLARAILEEEPFWVFDPEGCLKPYLATLNNVAWLEYTPAGEGSLERAVIVEGPGVWVSELIPPSSLECLILRPRNLVLGIGCNRGTEASEILGLIESTLGEAGLSLRSIRNLATIDLKSDEPGLLDAARALSRPIHFYSREELRGVAVPNPSSLVESHVGVQSVCEATALLSAETTTPLVAKRKTANVTLAVARAASPL